jgi:RNA polymerase sigma-70 factor (ECF subfamily)
VVTARHARRREDPAQRERQLPGGQHREGGADGATATARTWLLSIARRVAADAVRAAGRRPRTTGVIDWDSVAARTGAVRRAGDEAVLLAQLVAALHPDRHEAFVLTQVLDLSYAEAAQVCGCPVGTIRSRVARAREDLVQALDGGTSDAGRRREA